MSLKKDQYTFPSRDDFFAYYYYISHINRKIELYKKLADNNINEFSYSVLLDYKSKYIRKIRKQTSKGDRVLNKRIRVRLEIVEEKWRWE